MTSLPAGRTEPSSHKFVTLDGLRGLAATLVLVFHALAQTRSHLLPGAYLAVDLFFVLSGFVLGYAYQARLDAGMSVGRFMLARFIRLYPLYLLGTVVALVFVFAPGLFGSPVPSPDARTVTMGLVALPNPPRPGSTNHHLYPLDFPAWSLFFEVIANLAFAIVARFLTDRRLMFIVGAAAVALALIVAVRHTLNAGQMWAEMPTGLARVTFSFFAGVGIERLWRRGLLARVALPPLAGAAIVVVLFAVRAGPVRPLYDLAVIVGVIPLLILACARREPPGRLGGIFGVAGTASYAIYVLHIPVLAWLDFVSGRVTGQPLVAHGLIGVVAFALVVIATAIVADRFYDQPVRARLTRALLK